jgi:hypothetical protein
MLAEPEEDGSPLLDHLLAVERQTGVRPQILADAPSIPSGCEELWPIFNQLHACRGSNGFGPSRISFVDLDAWQRLNGVRLRPWEIEAIRHADGAYLARVAERLKQGQT